MKTLHLDRTIDLHRDDLETITGESMQVAGRRRSGVPELTTPLRDQGVLWVTTKDSFRTEASILQATTSLGGNVMKVAGLASSETGQTREPLIDIVRCADEMGYRLGFFRLHTKQQTKEVIGAAANMHTINALDDGDHLLQALADGAALQEATADIERKKIVFVGPGNNNVTLSLGEYAAIMGWDFVHTGPQGHRMPDARIAEMEAIARKSGGSVQYIEDWREAVPDATMVYTDVHASMGQKKDAAALKEMLAPYRVTQEMMDRAGPQARFGHCLPAERGTEVDNDVMEAPYSIVFPIAGYRAHTTTALMRLIKERRLRASK